MVSKRLPLKLPVNPSLEWTATGKPLGPRTGQGEIGGKPRFLLESSYPFGRSKKISQHAPQRRPKTTRRVQC